MKFAPALVGEIVRSAGPSRRNVRMLLKFLVILAGLVACYSVLFHLIMASEGQSHALFDGV